MPLLSNNKSIFILIISISMLSIIIMESVKKVKWIHCIDSEKLEKKINEFLLRNPSIIGKSITSSGIY